MEVDHTAVSDEVGLIDLIRMLWVQKKLIAVVVGLSLLVGLVSYIFLPRTFETKLTVRPLRQTEFIPYLELAQEGNVFPNNPVEFYKEFSTYLTDLDKLNATALRTGVISRDAMDSGDYAAAVQAFVSKIVFDRVQANDKEAPYITIKVRGQDKTTLETFVKQAVVDASTEFAESLVQEVQQRVAVIRNQQNAAVTQLEVQIAALRSQEDTNRKDKVLRLADEAGIARSLGIDRPLNLRAVEAAEHGRSVSAQINTGEDGPPYLQGYIALDEQINRLQARSNLDSFTDGLPELQRQVYLLKNDPLPARILTLLEHSSLKEPSKANLVRFNLRSIVSEKVFPTFSMFGFGSVFVGLLLGIIAALLWQGKRTGAA